MELQQQRGESTQNSLSKAADNSLGNNTMMVVDGNSYASNTGVANKENSGSAITLQSYMQQDGTAGSNQRDDGTQIWHQNGQKANTAFTPMTMEGMYGGYPAAAAPQMMYAVDMTDYTGTAYSTHPATAACQPFYQYGYAATGNQPAYTNSQVYQSPQVGYAASMASAQMAPFNAYSTSSSYVHPPPLQQQQQTKNLGYSANTQLQQGQQRGGGASNNSSYMQMGHSQNNRNNYYVNPYVQQQPVGQPIKNYVGGDSTGGMTPGGQAQQAPKPGHQSQKGTTKTPKLSSVFDNNSDNYTASWVSSTSSIPPDLKISPDHISNSGGTPVEYPANCWTTEQGQNAAAHNQLQQSASQQMGRVNLNHYGQKYASTSGANRVPTNYHQQQQGQQNQQPLRYVHPQSHQAKYNNAAANNNNNGNSNTPRQASGNTSSMPGSNMYASEYPQPPVHVNPSAAQSITQQMPSSDAISWADVLKRNGNCSSGETRFCSNNNNANFGGNMDGNNGQIKRQSGGSDRRGEDMNGMHRGNTYMYGPNSLHSAAIKANSLHDSGYTSSSIQQQQKQQQGNRFPNNPNRRSFGKPPPRFGNAANDPAKTTILPPQPPNFANGPYSAGGGANFPMYAAQQQQGYMPNNRYVFNPAGPPQNMFQGLHPTTQAENKLDKHCVAFNPAANYLRSPMPLPANFLPHALAPNFMPGMPPFPQMPPQFGGMGMGLQDEKFRNTWLDQAKPVNQVVNERMLNVYVTYHNNAVVITRNNAKENGHLPYYGSLLSTALQCMQSSNPLGFNNINNSNNRKSNYAGDKAYFKDKKRNGDADKEPKTEGKSPLSDGPDQSDIAEKILEAEKDEEIQQESVDTIDPPQKLGEDHNEINESIVVEAGTEAPAREDSKPNKVESTKTEEAAEKKE
uniref:Uncharacterized protein n=1 Tax=Ditylenchus dipsaci TaxID=166011 RepID=A0A915D7S9_9BILA